MFGTSNAMPEDTEVCARLWRIRHAVHGETCA